MTNIYCTKIVHQIHGNLRGHIWNIPATGVFGGIHSLDSGFMDFSEIFFVDIRAAGITISKELQHFTVSSIEGREIIPRKEFDCGFYNFRIPVTFQQR